MGIYIGVRKVAFLGERQLSVRKVEWLNWPRRKGVAPDHYTDIIFENAIISYLSQG